MGYESKHPTPDDFIAKTEKERLGDKRLEDVGGEVPDVSTTEEPVQQADGNTEIEAELDPGGSTAGSPIPEHIRGTRVGLARGAPMAENREIETPIEGMEG